MPLIIEGDDSNQLWYTVYNEIIATNNLVESTKGETLELSQVMICLNNPRQRWISSRRPSISIAFALAEVVWILNKSNDSRVINYWNPVLSKYSGTDEEYYGAYGYRLGYEFGIDQLSAAYYALKNNPNTRQVVLEYYKPDIDIPNTDGTSKASDIPCNVASIVKIRNKKLDWTQIMRSNDVILGLPYNIVQFTFLQEVLAGWLRIEVGKYTHFSDSMHMYLSDINQYSALNEVNPTNKDIFDQTKDVSEVIFSEIYSRMKYISEQSEMISQRKLEELSFLNSGYECFNNMMLIISAYVARKMNYKILEIKLIESCTNEVYVYQWKKWRDKQKLF